MADVLRMSEHRSKVSPGWRGRRPFDNSLSRGWTPWAPTMVACRTGSWAAGGEGRQGAESGGGAGRRVTQGILVRDGRAPFHGLEQAWHQGCRPHLLRR